MPERRQPAGRRARVRLQARADPRRRLRDAAEGGPLRASTSRSAASSRSAPATAPTGSSRWSPSTTAAPRRSAREARPRAATSSSRSQRRALPLPRGGRRRRGGACTRTARPATTTRRARDRSSVGSTPTAARGSARSRATSRCAWAASTRAVARLGATASSTTAAQEDLDRVGRPAPQDRRRRSGTRASARPSIEHYQQGINLLKDGPPCLELVRLYEEAASLYMHTGDNMLAIYASEKALRLAERLGETRAASRAHGIFGRVFGRIGDTEKARENLERSVELARESDHGETIRALLDARLPPRGLRGRLRAARGGAYGEALALAAAGRRPARRRSSCTPRSPSSRRTAPTGTTVERGDRGERRRSPSARASCGKLCFPYVAARRAALARGRLGRAPMICSGAPHELAEQVGWSEVAFQALFWLGSALRDRGDLRRRRPARSARALDVCERAGLIAQSIEATVGARGQPRAWPASSTRRREAADEAAGLAERLHYPVGVAASLEARGAAEPGRASYSGRRAMPGTRSAALATPSAANAYLRTARRSNNEQRARATPALPFRTRGGSPRRGACAPARRGGSRSPCPG